MSEKLEPGMALPVNQICSTRVEIPTIVTLPMGPDGQSVLCVQWFGSAISPLSSNSDIAENSQFAFPIITNPNRVLFSSIRPKEFLVVFMGMVKDWIVPCEIQSMIDGPGKGNEDAWIIWMISPFRFMCCGSILIPFSPCSPLSLLVCPDYGVVAPRPYANPKVMDEVIQVLANLLRVKK
jgi:hypothetical protein